MAIHSSALLARNPFFPSGIKSGVHPHGRTDRRNPEAHILQSFTARPFSSRSMVPRSPIVSKSKYCWANCPDPIGAARRQTILNLPRLDETECKVRGDIFCRDTSRSSHADRPDNLFVIRINHAKVTQSTMSDPRLQITSKENQLGSPWWGIHQ